MQVDFSEYETLHCNYCKNKSTEKCNNCTTVGSYIGIPSYYQSSVELGNSYFRLLSDYSKLLHGLGFEVRKQ